MNTKIPQLLILTLLPTLSSVSIGHAQSINAQSTSTNVSSHHETFRATQNNRTAIPNKRSPGLAAGLTAATYLGGLSAVVVGVSSDKENIAWFGTLGMLFAPTVGHSYAGEALKGIGLNALSIAGVALVIKGSGPILCNDCGNSGLVAAGLALHLGSTIYAVFDAHDAAERTNAKHRRLMFAPSMVGKNVGLGVMGTF